MKNKPDFIGQEDKDRIYEMIDRIRQVKDEDRRNSLLLYFTGYLDGINSAFTDNKK